MDSHHEPNRSQKNNYQSAFFKQENELSRPQHSNTQIRQLEFKRPSLTSLHSLHRCVHQIRPPNLIHRERIRRSQHRQLRRTARLDTLKGERHRYGLSAVVHGGFEDVRFGGAVASGDVVEGSELGIRGRREGVCYVGVGE